ncbi:MAG: glucosamine-6-phosphate isomerase, partial [Clostridiales bacterium]|nr:glucosamine-6-phosphate isomerase [Clostridiales bacterium]
MNFNSTVKGSMLEGFYPAGWDFDKIDACIDAPEKITERQAFWNKGFTPVQCDSLGEFETYMGHEIAMQIRLAKERKEKIAFILPVGPMGMYKWVVYFLKEWK